MTFWTCSVSPLFFQSAYFILNKSVCFEYSLPFFISVGHGARLHPCIHRFTVPNGQESINMFRKTVFRASGAVPVTLSCTFYLCTAIIVHLHTDSQCFFKAIVIWQLRCALIVPLIYLEFLKESSNIPVFPSTEALRGCCVTNRQVWWFKNQADTPVSFDDS